MLRSHPAPGMLGRPPQQHQRVLFTMNEHGIIREYTHAITGNRRLAGVTAAANDLDWTFFMRKHSIGRQARMFLVVWRQSRVNARCDSTTVSHRPRTGRIVR